MSDSDIEDFRRKLKLLDLIGYNTNPDPIYNLRNDLSILFAILENSLEMIIVNDIMVNRNTEKLDMHSVKVFKLMADTSYRSKVRWLTIFKVLKPDELASLKRLNAYRDWFAHPNSYRAKIDALSVPTNYKKVYRDMKVSWDCVIKKLNTKYGERAPILESSENK